MLNDITFRSILCLNGDLPSAEFFTGDLPVIAADGAANKLAAMNVLPHIIIGDLDSVHADVLARSQSLHHPDQQLTDFEKCLAYLEAEQLMPAMIVGVHGGCLDHVLNNVNVFLQTECMLYAPPMMGFAIKAGAQRVLQVPVGTKISLLGLPHAEVSTRGLKWNVTAKQLTFPGENSCFNRTLADIVAIEVHSGSLLVLVYQQVVDDAGLHVSA